MPTIASAVLGTELLERVRDRAARYEPLGYNVIRDAEGAIEAYSAAAEAVLRLERWDITFKEHVNHAASLEKLRTLPHGLDCRELAEGHELDFATLERASTPTRKSGVFERQGSTPIPAVVELINSPSKASLRPAKSFSDATAVTLAATATPPATDAASRPPSDDQARCANARRAVNAAIAELQILVRVVDLTFRQLSQIHFEIAMAGTKWRWIAQRSHRSRFGLRLLVVPWAHLFTKIPKLIFFADERLRVLREEDKIIHDALLHCRLCDAAVTQTIGTMHSVVSTIRAAMDDMLEDIEANPASTTEHDDKRTADALIRTAQELRSLVASASSKMLAACGGDAPKASDTQSHLKRPTYVALAVKTYLDKIQERLADHQPPDAWPRVRTLALGTAAFLAFRYRDQIREIPAMVQMAVDSANSWMVDPTVRLVQKFFKPREQRNFSATAQEQAALKTMVVEYHQDMAKEALTSLQIQAIKDAVDRNDLGRVNDDFVEFTRKPWLPIIRGLLPRIVLIQIQQQKVDLGALIDSTNDILHQNDMAVSMFACTPFGVILFALLYWWRRRHQQQLRALFADMRVCWWKLHRIMCGQHATIHRGTRLISRAAAQEEEDAEDEAEAMARDVDDENRFAPSSSRDVGRRASAARPPPLKPATPPPAGVRSIGPLDGHAAIASPPLPAAAATAASVESAREDEGGRDGDAESSSWGGALQPREQGQVLIQVHALRVMSEMVWPEHHAEAKMRCLDDLDEIEAKDASREARLRVLDRMALSYNFLRQSEF